MKDKFDHKIRGTVRLLAAVPFLIFLSGMALAQESANVGFDVELVDQNGSQINLYSDLIKEKTFAIIACFTTSTTICPPMGVIISRVEKSLGNDRTDLSFIVITRDPGTDSSERLEAWAQKVGFKGTLLTGGRSRIDDLLKYLRLFSPDKEDASPEMIIGKDSCKHRKRVNALSPVEVLSKEIKVIADGECPSPDTGIEN